MGTILDVEIEAATLSEARDLGALALTVARHWDDVLSTWKAEAELERLNRHAGTWVQLSSDLAWAIEQMRALSIQTQNAFNPCVGRFVLGPASHPTPPLIPELGNALGLLQGAARVSEDCRLDAGGIGKGIALDAIASVLLARGARTIFLNFGGSSQTFVSRSPGARVAVALPRLSSNGSAGILWLRQGAVGTSRTPAEASSGEIIDPRSGQPVQEARMATVCAASAAEADAWSTAIVVLGDQGVELAQRAGIYAVFQDMSTWRVGAPFSDRAATDQAAPLFECEFQGFTGDPS